MDEDLDEARSILSNGEQKVARGLREGRSLEDIAADRGEPVEVIEKAADRVREKTGRALSTLAESPFVAEAAAARDPDTLDRIRTALPDG